MTHHSQATTRAGTGKPAKTQGRRANTTLENNRYLHWLSSIVCFHLRRQVKKQAIKTRERKRILELGKDTMLSLKIFIIKEMTGKKGSITAFFMHLNSANRVLGLENVALIA